MDKIFLNGLQVETVIGIFEWERSIRQIVSLDLELACDARVAAKSDSIDAAINYKDIAKRLIDFIGNSEFQLVESLAEAVARLLIEEFEISCLRLSLAKPSAIEGSKEVGVIIERRAGDYD